MSTAAVIAFRLLNLPAAAISAGDLIGGMVCGAGITVALGIMASVVARKVSTACADGWRGWPAGHHALHGLPVAVSKEATPAATFPLMDYRTHYAAVMFTDVVGFSAATDHDEEGTLKSMASDLRLIHEECCAHGGKVLKTVGDGILAVFDSPSRALRCAKAIQGVMACRPIGDSQLLHRIGIHAGEVRWLGGELMGSTVNVAARLEKEAPPGGICLSQSAAEAMVLPGEAVYCGPRSLRNISEPVGLYMLPPPSSRRLAPVIELTSVTRPMNRGLRAARQGGEARVRVLS